LLEIVSLLSADGAQIVETNKNRQPKSINNTKPEEKPDAPKQLHG